MFRRKPKEQVTVDWLIVGLGNPGAEYKGTRHNIGFELLDTLANLNKVKLDQSKHKSRYGIGKIFGVGVALVKPLTYMNLSGQAIAPMIRQFGLNAKHCLILADDTDLPLGRVRIRTEGSAGGHNGHKSIIASLGTTEYPRVKLGIGRVDKDDTIDHVLGSFHPDERQTVEQMLKLGIEAVELILNDGTEAAMNALHSKS
jgi:PTH1 family peptidyl-tRNA hydrolase